MFANVLSLAFFAGAAMASSSIAPGDAFGIMALRSASPIHFAHVDAALNSIFLNLPAQNATCDDGTKATTADSATFSLAEDGSLSLFRRSATPQQLYADRSGMGQGKLGYTTGAEPAPRNGERAKFAIDESGDITFNGAGFLACPNSIDGAWSVWVDTGVTGPAGNADCLGFSARAVKIEGTANSCEYTQSQ
ncbi:hypothetical protein F4859DRAFT_457742 [Xylaria cf. heliscus]|nr:hypothetical protein F4859DRAFT_457742 [Xylaria cf. heliscus]